jgi:glycine/D-amino acid oxidase-like deaminating enzyme
VYNERHLKVSIKDNHEVVPREAPLLIWNDTQEIPWENEERDFLSESDEDQFLLGQLPFGAHLRPEGSIESNNILMLWPYHLEQMQPEFPVPIPASYPEVVLRGLIPMIPKLEIYLKRMPKPFVDGGYYTKTPENRLLVGPLPIKGSYLIGALSGFGLMAACGAAELLAAHITQAPLQDYAQAFMLDRYDDPDYLRTFEEWEHSNQL